MTAQILLVGQQQPMAASHAVRQGPPFRRTFKGVYLAYQETLANNSLYGTELCYVQFCRNSV